MSTKIVTIQARGADVRVEVPETVGPLGAFRSAGPAERCLASYADCVTERVVDQRVDKMVSLDGEGSYFVALFEYDRAVRS